MNEHTLSKNLKQLNRIQPREEWKKNFQAVLLSTIRQNSKVMAPKKITFGEKAFIYFGAVFSFTREKVTQPVVIMFLMMALVLGSSFTVNAAFYSLPGQPLYNLKLALERTQLALARSNTQAAELKIEFAKKRIDELEKIVLQPGLLEAKKAKVNLVIDKFTQEVNSVKKYVTKLSPDAKNSKTAFQIALSVDTATTELAQTLDKKAKNLSLDVGQDVGKNAHEAARNADATSISALETIIQLSATSTDAVSKNNVVVSVTEKISTLEKKLDILKEQIASIDEQIDTQMLEESLNQLSEKIAETKKLLESETYDAVLANIAFIKEQLAKLEELFIQLENSVIEDTHATSTDTYIESVGSANISTEIDTLLSGATAKSPYNSSTTTSEANSQDQNSGSGSDLETTKSLL